MRESPKLKSPKSKVQRSDVQRRNVRRRLGLWTFGLWTLLALSGCDEKRTLQPPVIYFGQHECDVCRMIISDERYAAGMIIEDEGGRFQSRVFDDIGCLLQQEQDDADLKIAARYVRDAQTSQWLDVAQATYLHSETLKTPMAFHTAACASPDQAKTMQQDHPGDVLSLNEVRERFRAGTLREF